MVRKELVAEGVVPLVRAQKKLVAEKMV